MQITPDWVALGIIPAYAGSTNGKNAVTIKAKDNPRIRGEHLTLIALGLLCLRIIPAYAGSTVCPVLRAASGLGSSPHTRGARAQGHADDLLS